MSGGVLSNVESILVSSAPRVCVLGAAVLYWGHCEQ
jgi:hypothetical protein